MFVIDNYMVQNCAFCEVYLVFNEVDHIFFSGFDGWLRMKLCQPTYCSKASRTFQGRAWSCLTHWQPFAWYYDRQCFIKLLDDMRAAINTWALWNRVVCIEIPHTMHSAHHKTGFSCILEQARCKRPHQVLGSPWGWSAIWREWKHRHWEESKTLKWGQCYDPYGVGNDTSLCKDNWERTYFEIFWKYQNWHSDNRECLLYRLPWHLVIETSSLTVNKPQSTLHNFRLLSWRHIGTEHQRGRSGLTDYGNSHLSGSNIQCTVVTGQSSQHQMSGPLWGTWR